MNSGVCAASICALMLMGCGGGGDGGSPAVTAVTSVSGVAAKGLIKHAKVLVCRIVNGAPEADITCAAGLTGSDGSYNVTLSDGYSGPLMIKVMPEPASVMTGETTGMDVPYTMTLRAAVVSLGNSAAAHVTPFSEMAAHGLTLSGSIDAAKIRQANAAVQNFMATLGIDLSVMPMIDLKSDGANATKLGMQANMVKQLARIAMAAKRSAALTDPSGVPCSAALIASQQLACAVAAMASVMTSYADVDPAKMVALIAALKAQDVTAVKMPIRTDGGTIAMATVDMTSMASMQAAMLQAGMSATIATSAANAMMAEMH